MKFFGHGILGMNARNLKYIRQKNSAESISLADSKMKTKRFLGDRGIPFASTYAVLKTPQEVASFDLRSIPERGFVIKPNHGSQGNGILIVRRNEDELCVQDEPWSDDDFHLHMMDIIHGSFSIQGSKDTVIIEELLTPGRDFAPYCEYGLADIRVIVVNLVPVTAMVRMPTAVSSGKANLAQGGAGLGLNIATGAISTLMQHKKVYTSQFPSEHISLANRTIPFWDEILLLSSQVQLYTKLGYLALDWVITERGPKLLEINARAGLEIQNVNLIPLASRLKKVEDIKVVTPEKGVEIAKALFSTGTTSPHSGKKVIPLEQSGFIDGKNATIIVNPRTLKTSVSSDLLPFGKDSGTLVVETERGLHIPLSNYHVQKSTKQQVELGRDSLSGFLIDPTVVAKKLPEKTTHWSETVLLLDEMIHELGKKTNLSTLLKPINYAECLREFLENPEEFDPVFQYNFPTEVQFENLYESLESVSLFLEKTKENISKEEFPLIPLFESKLREISVKIGLLEGYKRQDSAKIRSMSDELYGSLDLGLLSVAQEKLLEKNRIKSDKTLHLGKLLTLDEVILGIEQYFKKQGIKGISISLSSDITARMLVSYGRKPQIKIFKGAKIYSNELDALLAHEISTHLMRYLHGKESGLKIFQTGTGFYIGDEEGLAVYNSLELLPDNYEKVSMYEKYVLVECTERLSFKELVKMIRSLHPERSLAGVFSGVARLKQGIEDTSKIGFPGYGKGKIYLSGCVRVKKWIAGGGNPEKLACGKIRIIDIPFLEELAKVNEKVTPWLGEMYDA